MFNQAHDFQVCGHFSENNYYGENGLNILFRHCTPDAAHDSYARRSKDSCFPGTRDQHIDDITTWMTSARQERHHRLLWMYGPAGVGKSTIAQSCAKKAASHGVLGASFFFSRDNGVVDPARFFTTIAHQLSTQINGYRAILETKVRLNPALPTKTLDIQLQELIVAPFLELDESNAPKQSRAVIVDGLDECKGDSPQSEIVELVAESVAKHGGRIPLLWLFFSRPEPHIEDAFSDESTLPLCWQVELPVSREVDGEIRIYLRGHLRLRRGKSSSSASLWPSDEVLDKLVEMVAGLFIYASSLVKYIMDPDSLSPERQLQDVLSLHSHLPPAPDSNPIARLDEFYFMIMKRIPPKLLPISQQILLLNHELKRLRIPPIRSLANILGLALPELETSLSKLRSVLTLRPYHDDIFTLEPQSEWSGSTKIFFFHASFMEFLLDRTRSKEFCLDDQIHWQTLATKGLRLMKSMYPMNGTSLAEKAPRMRKLFSLLPDRIHPWPLHMLIYNELATPIQVNLLYWFERSGPSAIVIEELRSSDREMFRRVGLTFDVNSEKDISAFRKFPPDMRPYLTACQHWSQPEKPAPNTQPHPGIQDPNNGDKVWARISSALGEAMWDDGTSDANLDGLSLGDLDDLGHSEYIHAQVDQYFSAILGAVKLPQFDIVDEFGLVEFYSKAWFFFEAGFILLRRLQAPKSLLRAALVPWERTIYAPMQTPDNQLTAAQLKYFAMFRRGDLTTQWRDLTRHISRFFESISLMTFASDLDSGLYKLSHGPKDMEYFEVQHLRAVSDYYTTGRIFLPDDTLLTNLERFYNSWWLESITVDDACELETLKDQLKALFASMLKNYWEEIYAECEELLRVNNEGPLALICRVVGEVGDEDETEHLRTILEMHVKRTALAAMSRVHGGDAASPGDPVTCATALFEVEQQANKLWSRLGFSTKTMVGFELLKPETDITGKIIEEIIDERPEWRDAMDELRSPREIILESDSEMTSSPGAPKVVNEAVFNTIGDGGQATSSLVANESTPINLEMSQPLPRSPTIHSTSNTSAPQPNANASEQSPISEIGIFRGAPHAANEPVTDSIEKPEQATPSVPDPINFLAAELEIPDQSSCSIAPDIMTIRSSPKEDLGAAGQTQSLETAHGGSTPELGAMHQSTKPGRRKRDKVGGFVRHLFKLS